MAVLLTTPSVYAKVHHDRTIQISITDKGLRPSNILSVYQQPVDLTVKNDGHHLHQFSIPEFYVYSRTLQPGEVSHIQFTPYKVGRFDILSDPSGTLSPEFKGVLIVETTVK
jgi:plastocyanin domain-containing protein